MRLGIIFVVILAILAIVESRKKKRKFRKDKDKNADWKKIGEAQTFVKEDKNKV